MSCGVIQLSGDYRMDSKSIYKSYLFSDIKEGRVGFQCERSFRILLFLFDGWSKYTPERTKLYDDKNRKRDKEIDDGRLPIIYFDKLAMFSFRLWDKLFSFYGDKARKEEADPHIISFPTPFQEIPGKHGPGPGRFDKPMAGGDSKGPIYLLEILYELQNDNVLHYFEITPPSQSPLDSQDYRTTVAPAMPVTDPEELLKVFNELEKKMLMDLRNSLKRLSPSDIRALGTHANQKATADAIKFEFKRWKSFRRSIIDGLRNGTSIFKETREMLEFAEEAWLKSSVDRKKDYHHAYDLIKNQINHQELLEAFAECQKPPDEIWDTSEVMVELSQKAIRALAFTRYIHTISYFQDNQNERMQRTSKQARMYGHWWDESIKEMNLCGLTGFFSKVEDMFTSNPGKIRPNVRDWLINTLESF